MHVIGVTPPLLGGGFTKRCQPSSPLREEFGAGHSLPASYAGTDKKPLFTPPPVDEAPAPRGGDFAWQCVGGSYLKKEPARSNPAQEQGLHSTHYPTCTYVPDCPKHLLLVVAAACWLAWTADFDGLFSLCVCPPAVCPAQRGGRTHQSRAAGTGDW